MYVLLYYSQRQQFLFLHILVASCFLLGFGRLISYHKIDSPVAPRLLLGLAYFAYSVLGLFGCLVHSFHAELCTTSELFQVFHHRSFQFGLGYGE